MTPREIARLITEDPDIVLENEAVAVSQDLAKEKGLERLAAALNSKGRFVVHNLQVIARDSEASERELVWLFKNQGLLKRIHPPLSEFVLLELSKNPRTPIKVLEQLIQDKRKYIASEAQKNLESRE